jgi:hypothetical protein
MGIEKQTFENYDPPQDPENRRSVLEKGIRDMKSIGRTSGKKVSPN